MELQFLFKNKNKAPQQTTTDWVACTPQTVISCSSGVPRSRCCVVLFCQELFQVADRHVLLESTWPGRWECGGKEEASSLVTNPNSLYLSACYYHHELTILNVSDDMYLPGRGAGGGEYSGFPSFCLPVSYLCCLLIKPIETSIGKRA